MLKVTTVRKLLTVLVWLPAIQVAWACAICAPSVAEQTLTQRLYKSEAVVMAKAQQRPGDFSVTAVIRGVEQAGQLAGVTAGDDTPLPAPGTAVVLARNTGTWRVMAALPPERAAWVETVIAMRLAPDAPAAQADWNARFAFFAPDLESPIAAVAQVAYDELSIAPYGAMRAAAPHFTGKPLVRWLDQPALSNRHPLYALMAGFVATPAQVASFERRLLARSATEPLGVVSALMAAVLEQRGDTGLSWLERHYLQPADRTDGEVQAALLALRVHATDGQRIDKDAATRALRRFVQAQPMRAGYAASDLGDWGRWDFVPAFEQALDTDRPQVFASRYAAVLYLLRNPTPEAKAALERLRAKGRL